MRKGRGALIIAGVLACFCWVLPPLLIRGQAPPLVFITPLQAYLTDPFSQASSRTADPGTSLCVGLLATGLEMSSQIKSGGAGKMRHIRTFRLIFSPHTSSLALHPLTEDVKIPCQALWMEFGSSTPSFFGQQSQQQQQQEEEEQHRRTPSPLHPSSSFFSRRATPSKGSRNSMHKKQLHDEEDRRQEAGSTSSSGTSSSEDEERERRGAEEGSTSFSVRRTSSASGLTATAPPFVLPQSLSPQQHMPGPGKGGREGGRGGRKRRDRVVRATGT